MLSAIPFSSRLSTTAFALAIIAAFGINLRAQDANDHSKAAYVDDWSHHHLVYSNPGTREDAAREKKLDRWQKINDNPRFRMQQFKRSHSNRPVINDWHPEDRDHHSRDDRRDHRKGGGSGSSNNLGMKKDWNEVLGGGKSVVWTVGTVSGNVSSSSTLTMATVTFHGAATTAASGTGSFTDQPTNGQTVTIGSLVLTVGSASSTNFLVNANPSTGDTVSTPTITYQFETNNFFCSGSDRCVRIGATTSATATNLASAIGGSCFNTCPTSGNDPSVAVTTVSTNTVNINNATASSVLLSSSHTSRIYLNSTSQSTYTLAAPGGSNACSSATVGTFINPDNATNLATALAAAINSCHTSQAVAFTASSSTGTVTVTAAAAGTGGNSISLSDGLSNFTWAGTALTGGADGNADTTHFPFWSVNNYVSAAQLAINIATAVNSNTTVNAVIKATANEPASGQVTFTRLFSTTSYTIAVGTFAAFTGTSPLGTGGVTATVQPNIVPAKWGPSLTTASCANDFVVYPTGQSGLTTASTIVAYNNMYVGAGGCETDDPTVYWAYNTHTGYTVTTSPVISLDGTQVAFIESNSTIAELVLLKWGSGSGSSVNSPDNTIVSEGSAAAYRSCTAPCMFIIPFGNGKDDSISSPFYDYSTTNLTYDDALFVGDDSGNLHKFTGVFRGAPAEVTTSPWPVALGTNLVSSPVYDAYSGYVFVGDMGGILYSVVGATGTIHGNTGTAVPLGDAIPDAPLVDGTVGSVYAFVNVSGSHAFPGYNSVYQFSTQFTALGTPGVSALATVAPANGSAGHYVYDGMFDNIYFQSVNGTGNIYVVANTGLTTGAILYKVSVSGGSLTGTVAAAVSTLTPSGAVPWPSPLTEFCTGACTVSGGVTNSGTDYVFFSVNRGNKTGCTTTAGHGCIMAYNVSNPASATLLGTQDFPNVGTNGCWATGGISIDNSDTTAVGASQIYFVSLNGATAGGPNGQTSSACTAGTELTVDAIQAAQINP